MTRSLLMLCLLVVLPVISAGQSVKSTTRGEEQTLLQLEQQWMDAMKAHDEATLNRLVGGEFALAGLNDLDRPAVTRATWIDNAMHHLKVESFSFDKTKVHVFRDTAIVQSVFTWKGAFDNENFIDTAVLIDTWIRRDGHWQVVSRLAGDYKKPENEK